ncbi:replication-relaxation family protein, partial [Saccharopolyspora cebuensis]
MNQLPARQNLLRQGRTDRRTPRAANTAEHQARLASRLTARDRWLVAMLHEHRVLTGDQIAALAFPTARAARARLRNLWCWSVL